MEDDLIHGSIADIRRAITSKMMSVRELTQFYLGRIDRLNAAGPELNAVREIAADAMDVARARDEDLASQHMRGALHGIPILLKDNILAGNRMATTGGASALEGFVSPREASLVRRLRDAGAVILGKTNLTEFADYVSDVMPSGFSGAGGMVRNPHSAAEYGRGLGSSVGSAASVAAAFAPVAIGTETQNSIQAPACASSVYGFKPSVGFVSRAAVIPLAPSQDSPGPLARSVADLAVIMSVIGGPDCRDTASLQSRLSISEDPPPRNPGSLRIGVPRRMIADRAEFQDVMVFFEAALCELRKAGVTIIDPCDLPSAEQLQEVRSCVFRTEFKASLDIFLKDMDAPLRSLADLICWNEDHPEAIPYGQSLLIAASETTGLDNPQYRRDRDRDIALSRQAGIDAALEYGHADALIMPMAAAAKCTGKAGYPVLAVPVGSGPGNLPFGVTLTAGFGRDANLLQIGVTISKVIGRRLLPAL